jgi:Family of unknown function (DUF6459)
VQTSTFPTAPVAAPRLPARGEPTQPHMWATAFARAVAETLVGLRPAGGLSSFVSPEVREVLHRHPMPGPRRPHPGPRPVPHRVHVRRVGPDVVEANTVIRGDRVRAVAFRMEARRGRWICTALEIG